MTEQFADECMRKRLQRLATDKLVTATKRLIAHVALIVSIEMDVAVAR